MEEKHNPSPHELLRRQDTTSSWSDLPQDLLSLVFERLGFTDFVRAKSVCWSWYSASRHCVPKKQTSPWLILFPKDRNNKSCMLFNPEEKEKLYKTQDLGLDFTKSCCVSTSGNWLLIQIKGCQNILYIVNLFTQERINLPPIKSQFGETYIVSPVFWIDEETKDYVVVLGLGVTSVLYAKKGDTSWNPIPTISSCNDMVYKEHKLYFLSEWGSVLIFDFSGEIPRETFRSSVRLHTYSDPCRRKLVVTLTGDVLMVEQRLWYWDHETYTSPFKLYKVYSPRFFKQDEQVHSLGDQTMLWDLNITVLATDIKGLKRDSIYFNDYNEMMTREFHLFNLETRKMEPFHKFDCSRVQFSKARWFLPSFK